MANRIVTFCDTGLTRRTTSVFGPYPEWFSVNCRGNRLTQSDRGVA